MVNYFNFNLTLQSIKTERNLADLLGDNKSIFADLLNRPNLEATSTPKTAFGSLLKNASMNVSSGKLSMNESSHSDILENTPLRKIQIFVRIIKLECKPSQVTDSLSLKG